MSRFEWFFVSKDVLTKEQIEKLIPPEYTEALKNLVLCEIGFL